jgi:hypothetical protein
VAFIKQRIKAMLFPSQAARIECGADVDGFAVTKQKLQSCVIPQEFDVRTTAALSSPKACGESLVGKMPPHLEITACNNAGARSTSDIAVFRQVGRWSLRCAVDVRCVGVWCVGVWCVLVGAMVGASFFGFWGLES